METLWAGSGGVEQYLLDMLPELARRDGVQRVTVVTRPDRAPQFRRLGDRIEVLVEEAGDSYGARYLARRRLGAALRRLQPDVLFRPYAGYGRARTEASVPDVNLVLNALAFEPAERARYPLLSPRRLRFGLLAVMARAGVESARYVLFPSQYMRDVVCALVPGLDARSGVCYFGVPSAFEDVAREEALPPGLQPRAFVYYPAGLDWFRHQARVVESWHRLLRRGEPVLPLILGGTRDPSYARLVGRTIRRLGMEGHVRDLGFVPAEQHRALYRYARFIVMASTCESPSFVPLETMASEQALACARRASLPEYAGDAAVYFDPLAGDDMDQTFGRCLRDDALLADLRARARERRRLFTWSRHVDDLLHALQEARGA